MSDHLSDDELFAGEQPRQPQPAVDILAPAASPRRDPRERIRNSRLGTLVVLLITAFLVGGGAWAINAQQQQDAAAQTGGATVVTLPGNSRVPPPELGKPAQDFRLTLTDGTTVSLSDYRGKVVWLTFGASWCQPCLAEAPDIQAAYTKYEPQGLVVLAVNITEQDAAVKAFSERLGLTYPAGADPNSLIADEYRVSSIPAHYFIDRDGVIRDIRQGGLAPSVVESILTTMMGNP